MDRLDSKTAHAWHVAINQFNWPKLGKEWAGFMYDAKDLADEVARMALLFQQERTNGLRTIHQQCSRSEPVKLKENFLSCCLGKRCSQCPFLQALEVAELPAEEIDKAKAWTCAAHILMEKGKQQFLDTSEGYILTEDDKLYWSNVYASLAAGDDSDNEPANT
jgi:hypothetical protein